MCIPAFLIEQAPQYYYKTISLLNLRVEISSSLIQFLTRKNSKFVDRHHYSKEKNTWFKNKCENTITVHD